MGHYLKVVLLIWGAFLIRVLISCCECNSTIQNFDIQNLTIKNFDNSILGATVETDTICKAAVCFEISLSAAETFSYQHVKAGTYSVFPRSYATECECNQQYKASQTIDSISIISNYRLNYDNPSGSNVTPLFVARKTNLVNELYIPLNQIIEDFNHSYFFDDKTYQFWIYLTIPVEFAQASFNISVYLSDGTRLISSAEVQIKNC